MWRRGESEFQRMEVEGLKGRHVKARAEASATSAGPGTKPNVLKA
jgi:hypothetical protein